MNSKSILAKPQDLVYHYSRYAKLAQVPLDSFGMALGLFAIGVDRMKWTHGDSPFFSLCYVLGCLSQCYMGILNWYQGKGLLAFIDIIFGLFFGTLIHQRYFLLFGFNTHENEGITGNFLCFMMVISLVLIFCSIHRKIYLVNFFLLFVTFLLFMIAQWSGNYRFGKTAGWFAFFSSLSFWVTGTAKILYNQTGGDTLITPDM